MLAIYNIETELTDLLKVIGISGVEASRGSTTREIPPLALLLLLLLPGATERNGIRDQARKQMLIKS